MGRNLCERPIIIFLNAVIMTQDNESLMIKPAVKNENKRGRFATSDMIKVLRMTMFSSRFVARS
jgi:hypothetical protein